MRKRLYVAYGSNLNLAQMAYRCPTARLIGTGSINNYELQFKGFPTGAFATISQKPSSSVPVGVFEIQPMDERSLDRYEGYPTHYFKREVPVQMQGGEKVKAMVYIMNPKMQFGMPASNYYCTVHQGYKDCGLDTQVLNEAVQKSAGKYYENTVHTYEQQLQLRIPVAESENCEDEEMPEEDYDDDEDMDYSYGMQL